MKNIAGTAQDMARGPRPFDGWALQAALGLEKRASVAVVSRLFAASDLRRAAAFLALAAWEAPTPVQAALLLDLGPDEYAHWLLSEDPLEIAQILGTRCSDLRELAGLGAAPLAHPEQYQDLACSLPGLHVEMTLPAPWGPSA